MTLSTWGPEEQQLADFIQRVSRDEALRQELARDPQAVIGCTGLTPRVAEVVRRMLPQLVYGQPLEPSFTWR